MNHQEYPYPEIRTEARRLLWAITRTFNLIVPENSLIYGGMIKPYTEAMEWLGAVVVDDWQNLQDIVEEAQAMPILLVNGYEDRLWRGFVDFLIATAQKENIKFEFKKPRDIPVSMRENIKNAYFRFGDDNLLLQSINHKSKPFGKKETLWVYKPVEMHFYKNAKDVKKNDVIVNLENKHEQIMEIQRTHDGDIYLNKNKYHQDAELKVIR